MLGRSYLSLQRQQIARFHTSRPSYNLWNRWSFADNGLDNDGNRKSFWKIDRDESMVSRFIHRSIYINTLPETLQTMSYVDMARDYLKNRNDDNKKNNKSK